MRLEHYHALTERLQENLQVKADVLALIALGSMAGTDRQPDEYSDHDFFVITETGKQQAYRDAIDWLPYPEQLLLHFQETDHGCKAIYQDGHILEYAIFDLEELKVARINSNRVVFDKANITRMLPSLQASSGSQDTHPQKRFDTLISNILVGSMRAKRGELMSAHVFIKQHAVYAFMSICWQQLASDSPYRDNLDPFRRFEQQFPQIAADLNNTMQLPIQQAAISLLKLCEVILAPAMPNPRNEALQAIAHYIRTEKNYD